MDVKQVKVITEFNNGGKSSFQIPAGKWRIVRYVCAPTGQPLMIPSGNSNGLMLDHFSSEAQIANMNYIIGRLKTKFKNLRNQSLKYLYEDSYEVNTAVWTPRLPGFFKSRHGYALESYLPALDGFVINNADVTSRFYFDFNKTLSDLIVENHYAKGKEICEAAGIGFYAEAGGPGKPIHNVPFEDLKALGALTVPRGEFWNRHPQLEALQIVKGISSAAHIYNQVYVEAESFTSVWLWQEGPDQLKPLADRAMCEGLNRFVYHTFPHTTPEAGSPGWIYNFGTIINTTNGWWPKSQGFHQYLARCSFLLQQGNFHGDVAFYYGDEAPNFVKPKHVPATLGKGYDYDVVNSDAILNRMQVRNGKIYLPHGQYYEMLVLPEDARMNPQVLQKLEQMLHDGATIIGKKPSKSYSLADSDKNDKAVRDMAQRIWGNGKGNERAYGNGKIVSNKSVRQSLVDKSISPDVEFYGIQSHDSCDFIHRVHGNTDIYFIRNVSSRLFKGSVTFRVRNKQPRWWNPINGQIFTIGSYEERNGRISIPLSLKGHESAFIVFDRAEQSNASATKKQFINTSAGAFPVDGTESTQDFTTPWSVRFAHKVNGPFEVQFSSLTSWHTSKDEALKYYSGSATYTNHFEITKEQLNSNTVALLELNEVKEIAEVYLNGESLGTHWYCGQQFNISRFLKEGANTVTIEVVNSINNGLVGDAKKPEQFRFYKSNISKLPNAWMQPFAEAPLLRAGLLGPVKIRWIETPE